MQKICAVSLCDLLGILVYNVSCLYMFLSLSIIFDRKSDFISIAAGADPSVFGVYLVRDILAVFGNSLQNILLSQNIYDIIQFLK